MLNIELTLAEQADWSVIATSWADDHVEVSFARLDLYGVTDVDSVRAAIADAIRYAPARALDAVEHIRAAIG